MKYFFLFLLIVVSCREMYDEDYEKDLEESGTGSTTEDVSYTADLVSTDPNLPTLSGTANINITNNEVSVNLTVEEIPANIIQIHYSYMAATCDQLNISIPNENTTTRSYTVSENQNVSALVNDLKSSGASTSDDDINLSTKSFLVKAFSNFSGLPNPTGTNQITILCGDIRVTTDDDGGDAETTTTTGDTGVTTTSTTGTTTF